jgi:hypothetical protein
MMVRAAIRGVFATYKVLRDGSRRAYWYHRATGQRLHGEPGSAEFIAGLAPNGGLVFPAHASTGDPNGPSRPVR